MHPVRLIATDLDGTLLHSDGSVTPRTRAALLAAEARGVDVVFVTGRPLRWAEEVFEHVGRHGFAIVSNGALVWDVANGVPALERSIPAEVILEAGTLLKEAVPGSWFATETLAGIALEEGFLERYPVPPGSTRGDFATIAATPAYKLLARHEELAPQEFWDRAEEAIGHLVEITWSSATTLLEISAHQVTKASTLAVFCDERGITPDQVVAFGDMPNDLAMLAWAGTPYAMANAHPTVLEATDLVAPPNDEDGVARVIESLLEGRPGP